MLTQNTKPIKGLSLVLFIFISFQVIGQSFKERIKDLPDYLPGVILLRTNSSLDLRETINQPPAFKALADKYKLKEIRRPFISESNPLLQNTYRLSFDVKDKNEQILNELQGLSLYAFAEQYPVFKIAIRSNDPYRTGQYALDLIQADSAWTITQGAPTVGIAIVDNAVYSYHPDLRDNISLNPLESYNGLDDDLNGYIDDVRGYDVAHEDTNTAGDYNFFGTFNHGTHCAGIASATTNNEIGISSIGYQSGIIPIKADDGYYFGLTVSHALEGVSYAASLPNVNIISMSWGSALPNATLALIISSAYARQKTLIAAAGNDTANTVIYPAALPEVIAVAATGEGDTIAYFSNYGVGIDLAAPGVNILSTVQYSDWSSNNTPSYLAYSGTSMSTPMVAGLAALILSENPLLSPQAVKLQLQAGCDNIDDENPGYEGSLGAGRINAFKSLAGPTAVVGLEEDQDKNILFYPNPVQDQLFLQVDNNELLSIEIFNAKGELILQKALNQSGYIDLIELPSGMYWLRSDNGNHRGSSFIKM